MHIGQKVECIGPEGNWNGLAWDDSPPVQKGIYTVRSLYIDPENGIEGIRLVEIIRTLDPRLGMEGGWERKWFRPLLERKTDISIFTEMLKPAKEPVA